MRMRAERNDRLLTRQRHTIYCREWHDHVAKIAEQAARIEQLESSTREQSDTINGLQSAVAARVFTINELQSSLRLTRKQKSLSHRLRLRVKWLTRKD
jgi:uncharacterized coiled-coil protein SlyX